MSTVILAGSHEAKQLQEDIQNELVSRGMSDAEDPTMAEYVTVMLINQKTAHQINEELTEIQGQDFDPTFTPWLFSKAEAIVSNAARPGPASKPDGQDAAMEITNTPVGAQPVDASATQGVKRAFSPDNGSSEESKRRSLAGSQNMPGGPRDSQNQVMADGSETRDGRQDGANHGGPSFMQHPRGPPLNQPPRDFQVGAGFDRGRGHGRGRGGRQGLNGPIGHHPYQRPMQQRGMPNPNNGFFPPPPFPAGPDAFAMQSMMMQPPEEVMQMQMMMQQMAQAMQANGPSAPQPEEMMQMQLMMQQVMMQQMEQAMRMEQAMQNNGPPGQHQPPMQPGLPQINAPPRPHPHPQMGGPATPARPGPAGTKFGNRTLVNENPLPEKPTSAEICKFGIGCTNKRCPYSHPSPVATESTGMVLRTQDCPDGKGCKDPDCPYSHISPAQVNEDTGPSKVLCRFAPCTNPACQFRHEDANGNPIPPPALTRSLAASSDMETDEPAGQDDAHVTPNETTGAAGLTSGKALESSDGKTGFAKPLPGKPLDGTIPVPCRFGAACVNPRCKFIHGNKRPCNFGVRCFKADCPFSHPPGRKLGGESTNKASPFKPKEGQLVDRTFGGDSDAVEKVLPGSGLNSKSESGDDIRVDMG